MLETITENWEASSVIAYLLSDKLVRFLPGKWQDITFDLVITPIYNAMLKKRQAEGKSKPPKKVKADAKKK